MPVSDVEVKVVGETITVRTDQHGNFLVPKVPPSKPISIAALVGARTVITMHVPTVTVNPGETVDLGTLSVSGCASSTPGRTDAPTVIVQVEQVPVEEQALPMEIEVQPEGGSTL
jgi:hypothetical protein